MSRKLRFFALLIGLLVLPVLHFLSYSAPIRTANETKHQITLNMLMSGDVLPSSASKEKQPMYEADNEVMMHNITADFSNSEQYASAICNPIQNDDLILIWVYTAPTNFEKRKKIRDTWASVARINKTSVKTAFFVGRVKSASLQMQLTKEASTYHDIIQDRSYVDAYRNLTRKGISAMYWISTRCPRTLRVVKADDDTLVNPYNLVTFVRSSPPETLEKFICKVTKTSKPIRRPKSKYFVPVGEFNGEYYPLYCQGYAYMIPPQAISHLLDGVRNINLITMEDVYITGLLGMHAGVSHHPLTPLYATTYLSSTEDLLKKIILRKELVFIGHSKSLLHYDLFWKLITERHGH